MNYELKSVSPLSVFLNAIRIFLVVGFIVAIINVFIAPPPTLHFNALWQKIAATVLFTGVYGLVVTFVLLSIALLYNAWVEEFRIQSFFLRVLMPSIIAGFPLGFGYGFGTPSDSGFLMRLITALIATVIISPALAAFITIMTTIGNALVGQFHGARVHLEQQD